jgi:hypothetical protein
MGRLKTFLKVHLKKFMTKKEISKNDARKILQEYLVKTIEITDQKPTFGSIYNAGPKNRVWSAHIPSATSHVGGSRIIIISKETGGIYFDGIVGE